MSDLLERLQSALKDRYTLERELGRGGMATVYLAEDRKHDRKVAIKVFKPELAAVLGAERFVQEIKTTAALTHPHILPLFDSGRTDEFLYYVMPYLEGETLREKLNRETQLGVEEAVRIATEVADALEYAHEHGVIHRDIKPENILLHAGRPMVMDFGIALAVSAAAGGRMTETGLSLGTPHYMSPEQATAGRDITNRSDIYSLASVLYEMLTGDPPFTASTAQAIILQIVSEEVVPVQQRRKTVPANVAAALATALQKLPADRFDTAKSFAEALENPGFSTPATGVVAGLAAGPSFRLTALAATLAVMVLVLAGLATWGWLRPPPKPVARYALAIPPDQAIASATDRHNGTRYLMGFSLAPDGSWLVYTGPGSRPGETQLWVKRRDGLEATPLPGTTGAEHPWVSPDGEWILFTADDSRLPGGHARGVLRRVPASGGVATTIIDTVRSGIPAAWLDDGTVAYMHIFNGSLWRVPVTGGVSQRLTAAGGGGGFVPVAGLPGGRGILTILCDLGCTPRSELRAVDFRSGEDKLLLPDVSWAGYADGRLLFVRRDGGMFAVPFDLDTLALDGAAVPLFDGVWVGPLAHVSLSSSGTLAYLAGKGPPDPTDEAIWVSRDGRAVPVDTTWNLPGFLISSSLSPDGKRLAVLVRNPGESSIWIKELDQGPTSRLTAGDVWETRPSWTPDGRSVMFVREGDLYARRADGTGQDSLVLDREEDIHAAQWSRDGQWLVVNAGGVLAFALGRDTVPRPLLSASYYQGAATLSPDARWLAYVSEETGRREVVVRPFPDVEKGKWQISTDGGTGPNWSHSGRELLFRNGRGEVVSQAVLPGESFQRGEQRVLPVPTTANIDPDDERFLAFRYKTGAAPEEPPVLVVVENWLEEVKRAMKGR